MRADRVRLPVSGRDHVRPGVHQRLADETRTGAVQEQQQLQQQRQGAHARMHTHTHSQTHKRGGRATGAVRHRDDRQGQVWKFANRKEHSGFC